MQAFFIPMIRQPCVASSGLSSSRRIVWLELEFKPEGKLKEFTHVELKMTEGEKSFVFSAALRETRSSSGSIIVTFTASRAYFEKITLSVVMHSPREACDHTYELRMKDFVDLEKVR